MSLGLTAYAKWTGISPPGPCLGSSMPKTGMRGQKNSLGPDCLPTTYAHLDKPSSLVPVGTNRRSD
eukprot:8925354-Heterocapsa_arctica.AAC.1